jgi:hypothetical protein
MLLAPALPTIVLAVFAPPPPSVKHAIDLGIGEFLLEVVSTKRVTWRGVCFNTLQVRTRTRTRVHTYTNNTDI